MERMKISCFTVMIALIFCSSLYGNETATADINQENVTDEEMGWPHKVKMSYQFDHFSGPQFILYNKAYGFAEIKKIFALADIITVKLFDESFKRYKVLPGNDQLESVVLAKKAIAGFNAFIAAGSPETAQLKEYLKKLYIEKKKSEMQVQQEEIPYFTADKPLYLGIIGTFDVLASKGSASFFTAINPSFRIGYFFKENWKKHNFGFFVDLGYMYCVAKIGKSLLVEHYLTLSPNIVYKTYFISFRKSIQFLLGIGPYFALRIAGREQYTIKPGTNYFEEYNFKRMMIGMNFNIGLFAIFPESKYAITFLMSIRVSTRQSQINYGSVYSGEDAGHDLKAKASFYVGFELGILFKVN